MSYVYRTPEGHSRTVGDFVKVVVTSFGYLHGDSPQADITIDTRRHFRNPHHDPHMRELTGLDSSVSEHVLGTAGVANVVRHAVEQVLDLLFDVADRRLMVVRLAVGCAGGRHRSVAIAERVAELLRAADVGVDVEHRDVGKPVVQPV